MLIFYFFVLMLMPVVMFGIGKAWSSHPPKTINGVYGYRTTRSMKSQESWEFAHRYFGRLSLKCSYPLIAVTLIVLFLFRNSNYETLGVMAVVVTMLQLVPFILLIIPTEIALRKNFDNNGYPKSGRDDDGDNIY